MTSRTGLSPSSAGLSRPFRSPSSIPSVVLQPRRCRNSAGLGCSPFARHYLGNHCLFSLPAGTKMFQFPAFAHSMVCRASSPAGCPIRIPADQRLFAPPRGFSQLITSFVASESQGIRHAPFVTFLRSTASLPHSVFRSLFLYSFQYVKDPFSWRISGSNR